MSNNENGIESLAMKGSMNLDQIQEMLGETSSSVVTVEDWGITYNSGNPITGIGMLAYSANGSVLYCLQYSNGFSNPQIGTSIGTTLYKPQDGNQALCVVYGWTDQGSFYLTQVMPIESV
ncbi:MAG: hypothetical protein ABIR47_07035 [Candidatus Kapaibacterium sp.]